MNVILKFNKLKGNKIKLNFTAAINTYTIDLEEQLNIGIEQDENYLKLQAKGKENPIESLSTGYNLNEKGFLLYNTSTK